MFKLKLGIFIFYCNHFNVVGFLLKLKLTMQGPTTHSRAFCGKLFDSQHGTRTGCFLFSQSNIECLN